MTSLVRCYQGSVNRWECDENDHLNVRFFMQKTMEALHIGLIELGLVPPDQRAHINSYVQSQHLRFLAEARVAAPISGFIGVLSVQSNQIRVLTELCHSSTNQVLMASIHELVLPTDNNQARRVSVVKCPAYAGSRGIADEASTYRNLSIEEALGKGFASTGHGVIQQDECEDGELGWYQYMGRVSDSVPNLWAQVAPLNDPVGSAETHGRAVLEYRLDFAGRLKQGHRFKTIAGITGMAGKTLQFTHLTFDLESNLCMLTSTAVSIILNLQTRKSEALSDQHLSALKPFLIQAS